jgi:hypothetical protein
LAGKMDLREMIDLDLLVRPDDFGRTVQSLAAHADFTCGPPDPWSFEQPFVYRHGGHGIRFELHRSLNRPERFTLETDALFARSRAQTAARRILSAEDALLVLIGHTLVHLVDGIREQTWEEAALLARCEEFSWDRFGPLLIETGIGRFGRALLSIAAARRGFSLPQRLRAGAVQTALLAIKTPGRGRGAPTWLYRAAVELYFVKHPLRLAAGYLRGRRAQAL